MLEIFFCDFDFIVNNFNKLRIKFNEKLILNNVKIKIKNKIVVNSINCSFVKKVNVVQICCELLILQERINMLTSTHDQH